MIYDIHIFNERSQKTLLFVSVESSEVEDFDACLGLNPFFGKAPGPAQAAALTTHAQVRQREGVDIGI